MADKLLVRAYNVELGDCIYVRMPDAKVTSRGTDDFHMLIDCGSLGSFSALEKAITHLKADLPSAGGDKKRLDLLVVTHEHKDHIAGFDPELFGDLKIENIWMSAAMNREHPHSERSFALKDFALNAMRQLEQEGAALSPQLQELMSLFSVTNDVAMETLVTTLPEANGIKPRFVKAGDTAESLELRLNETTIDVLAPENDIDGFYVGAEADDSLRRMQDSGVSFRREASIEGEKSAIPTNISAAEFKNLRARMFSNAFAFTSEASKVINNSSVVLLIVWKGKRLLFVGDAEWDDPFKVRKHNGSWNVMAKKRMEKLGRPVDFLKIGHHGSENATPWNEGNDEETETSKILDAILPVPSQGRSPTASAIVSTVRSNRFPSIPSSPLLVEIGKRVRGTRNYEQALTDEDVKLRNLPHFSEGEKTWIGDPQPLRTDLEALLSDEDFVQVEIAPAS